MSEWKEYRLEDVAEKFAMGPFGSNIKAENFVSSGVPVIRGTNLNSSKYVGGEFVFLSEEKADQLKTSNCFAGDLVLTHRGTLGQVCLVPEGQYDRYVVSQSGMKASAKKELLDKDFLFYFFKSSIGQHELLQHEAQVGVPSISNPLTSLKSVRVLLPPLPEQRAIAGVLSSLDDKIDLLHRQNKTLEGMAQALWRKMFIEDADPNWEETSLDKIASFLNGLPCQKYPPDSGVESLPVIKIKELRTGTTGSSDRATPNVPSQFIIIDGDILFSWSGSLEVVIWSYGKGVLNQHLFKVTSNRYPKWFYYYWLRHHLSEFRDIAQDKATTMGHIQRHHLSDARVTVPDTTSLKHLDTQIAPLFERLMHNLKAVHNFSNLRDVLLPKLMSGEVRVRL